MEATVRVSDYDIDRGLVLALAQLAKDWLRDREQEGEEER